MTEDPQRRKGRPTGFVRVVGILGAAAALVLSIEANSQAPEPPRGASGAKAIAGSIVEFREASGGHILYLEAKGGILTPLAPPGPGSRRQQLPPLESAAKAGAAAEMATKKPAGERKAKP